MRGIIPVLPKTTPLVIVLIALCLLVGGGWLGMEIFAGLFRKIVPIAGLHYSTDMAPTEVVLRSDVVFFPEEIWPEPIVRLPRVWRLSFPRAFIKLTIGSNYETYTTRVSDDTSHFVSLEAFIDPTSQSLRPVTLPPTMRIDEDRMTLVLSNEPAVSRDRKTGDFCERLEYHLKHKGDECNHHCDFFSYSPLLHEDCMKNFQCRIYMGYKGWKIELAVPWRKISDHEHFCEIAQSFLNDHTISQDSAFIEKNELRGDFK